MSLIRESSVTVLLSIITISREFIIDKFWTNKKLKIVFSFFRRPLIAYIFIYQTFTYDDISDMSDEATESSIPLIMSNKR